MMRLTKAFVFIRLITLRLLPVVLFAALFVYVATAVDRHNVEKAPGEEFINYSSFTVQNAREGEDVYFQVCRDHKANYNFDGKLSVYVITLVDEKPVQVYARDIQGQIRNECDNKVIMAKDFRHTPNTYEMSFCVDFKVKYDIKKTVCKTSNRYRIYTQPSDINSRIETLQRELETLRSQRNESEALSDIDQPSDLSVPSSRSGVTTSPSTSGGATTNPTPVNPTNPSPTPTTPEPPAQSCTIDLLGIKLLCR